MSGTGAVTVIEPSRGWVGVHWRELWQYRDLFYFLVWRDIKVRYKQTALGASWALLQPILYVAVFTVFFGHLAGIPTDGLPYPIFFYVALLPWMLFASAVSHSANSVVNSAHLITKVYFPPLLIPAASIGSACVDFAIAGTLLPFLMAYYGIYPGLEMFLIPLFVIGALATALGVGLLVAAATVSYRDFRYVLPYMLQVWFFITPILYPLNFVPSRWHWVLYLNPMTGFSRGFRMVLLDRPPHWSYFLISCGVAVALLVVGVVYFRKAERTFADMV